MTIDFPKFRKLLCHLRELLSGPCRIDYINGSDTFPPPLSKEEEQEVFAQLHAGSTEARETLIVHNLRLVVYIAKKFESSPCICSYSSCLTGFLCPSLHFL